MHDRGGRAAVSATSRRILVTGGAGFLGAHLCERLLLHGHRVFCLDNFSTGKRNALAHLHAHPRLTVIAHDVTQPFDLPIDQIYNLACPASPIHYQANPVHTLKTNVLGAVHLLDLAKRRGARILQCSTSEVYGNPAVHPQPESYPGCVNITGPRACYDEGKRCVETFFLNYARQYKIQVKIARIFNTYGPGMHIDDGRVVSNFIVQALRGEEITVYGDGLQTRAFCYVQDMVEGLVDLMNSQESFTGPVNLGNPQVMTIIELARFIRHVTQSDSLILHRSLPVDDPIQRCPDIRLAMRALAWRPNTDLHAGLRLTVAHFRTVLKQSIQCGSVAKAVNRARHVPV